LECNKTRIIYEKEINYAKREKMTFPPQPTPQPNPQPHKLNANDPTMDAAQQQLQPTTNPLQTPPLTTPTDTLKFFLANVGFTQTAPEIKSYIEQYFGPVNFVKLIAYHGDTSGQPKHKGYGFLYMMTEEGATALESYVNAFPGNKIRLVEREGVYVAKHDDRRAAAGTTSDVAGEAAFATAAECELCTASGVFECCSAAHRAICVFDREHVCCSGGLFATVDGICSSATVTTSASCL
jgi:hypothetical protein